MNENITPMAHEEAKTHNAVESYLLNELTEEQRCRFEEHYFECQECADAVRAGQVLIEGIRPPIAQPEGLLARLRTPVTLPSWRLWSLGAALAASLALFTVRLPIPVATANTTILARELEKSAVDENSYSLKTPSATVEVDPYGTQPFPFYRMTITRDTNRIASQVVPAPAKPAGNRLSLQLSSKALGKGAFTVTLEGLDKADATNAKILTTYRFSIASAE